MENEILDMLKAIQLKMDSIESKMEIGFNEVSSKIDSLSTRVDNISFGIASMISTEVVDELSNQLKEIKTDVKFIKRKVQDTEEDVFVIQDHLKLIK